MRVLAVVFRVADARRKANLIQRIKAYGSWMSLFDGVVFVKTLFDPKTVQVDLLPLIAQTDSLLIVPTDTTDTGGYLPREVWNWINEPV